MALLPLRQENCRSQHRDQKERSGTMKNKATKPPNNNQHKPPVPDQSSKKVKQAQALTANYNPRLSHRLQQEIVKGQCSVQLHYSSTIIDLLPLLSPALGHTNTQLTPGQDGSHIFAEKWRVSQGAIVEALSLKSRLTARRLACAHTVQHQRPMKRKSHSILFIALSLPSESLRCLNRYLPLRKHKTQNKFR